MGEYKVEESITNVLNNTIRAFNEGYELGREYGKKVFNDRRIIKVEYTAGENGELEFTKFNGGIINYGRSLPF